jgi:hypothetical protein
MKSLASRTALWTLGGLAIVAFFFFGTLLVLDYRDRNQSPEQARDALRAEHARLIKDALERYRTARGTYPVFPDNPISDLKAALVDTKYLASVPVDPVTGKQYRYVSDGKVYGMLFSLETGASCLVGTSGRGFWGNPPMCPFQ